MATEWQRATVIAELSPNLLYLLVLLLETHELLFDLTQASAQTLPPQRGLPWLL